MNPVPNIFELENGTPRLDKVPAGVSGDVLLLHQRKYSVPEAAELLGISETNLRTIIKRGELPVIQILPTKQLILESELEAFLQDRHVFIREKDIVPPSRIPPAPDFVRNSEHLKRKTS